MAELCRGTGDDADRFDRATSAPVDGLAEVVSTRLLAICHPEKFIANYRLRTGLRDWPGTLQIAQELALRGLLNDAGQREVDEILAIHSKTPVAGAAVVRTHNLIVEALRPYFVEDGVADTWGMSRFLYWLMERYSKTRGGVGTRHAGNGETDGPLGTAARELLCDVGFLNDVVALLEDKRQVVLYGPPGTGKTFFAQRLAKALTSSADARTLVQFHPAYSYEDFFEGFRPHVGGDGHMTYKLTPGPLVRLAERAEEWRGEKHVMVIDEINRANLPRVLGELLYLLEYRDEEIQTQYRPDDTFSLPSNLWFIGTMNTADRSIALIDAAMRRRFHFVPFFPNHGPTAGLLHRWMQRNSPEQEWVAGLVDKVNADLAEQMGGDHSLIGPSHFMKSDLDKDGLRRIWEFNIEPLIEDQLFGRQDVIDSFRFGSVWRRYGPDATSPGAQPGEPGDQPADPADEAGNLAGESEGAADEGDA